jgi:putative membrane protein
MTEHAVRTPASVTRWRPERPRFRPLHLLRTWLFSAIALVVAAWLLPGAEVNGFAGALAAAAVIAVLNAILPPLVAALRLPFMLVLGFLLVLVLDALMLLAADDLTNGDLSVDGFWWALLVALVAAAVTLVLEVVAGVDDDSEFSFRVIQRIARSAAGHSRITSHTNSTSTRVTLKPFAKNVR